MVSMTEIHECRIDFGQDGDLLVILLAGGTKKRQDVDVTAARERWRDYK